MKLSIVTTLYNSSPYVIEFCNRARLAADQITMDYEILLVDDGSRDDSLVKAIEIGRTDSKIRIIELSRNFGHHRAIMTGLQEAKGELVFLIDSDLQESPEWLVDFYQKIEATQADVIYGVQKKRKGGFFDKISGTIFYRLFNLLSSIPIPPNLLTVRLMRRKYLQALLLHREREIVISGLWASTGFHQVPQLVEKKLNSNSSYTFPRRLEQFITGLTTFSHRPLHFIFYLGCFIILLSLIGVSHLTFLIFSSSSKLPDWELYLTSLWFLGGLLTCSIGIIGFYLSRIDTETKQRPYTIVRNIHFFKQENTLL